MSKYFPPIYLKHVRIIRTTWDWIGLGRMFGLKNCFVLLKDSMSFDLGLG